MKNKVVLFLFILISSLTYGQFQSFQYYAKIQKANDTWHKIELNEKVLGGASQNLSDVRIFQVNDKDTIETGYLINAPEKQVRPLQTEHFSFHNNEFKKTLIKADFETKTPVSGIKLKVRNTFDFYRDIRIYGSSDSIADEETENMSLLFSGDLSSKAAAEFHFDQTIVKYLLLVIENNDNQALNPVSLEAEYHPVSITARFEKEGDYFLCYGDPELFSPDYDIFYYKDKIPKKLTNLDYEIHSNEQKPIPEQVKAEEAENPFWLWGSLSLIVVILLIFTLRMIRNKS